MNPDKQIAFFDFDGTITTADTMLELIKFHVGTRKYYAGLARISPWMLGMKLKLLSRQKAKEKMLTHFFRGMSEDSFQALCQNFSLQKLPEFICPSALQKIQEYKQKNVEVVVVTASARYWIEPWCQANELALIATELEVESGTITGKIKGLNCNGIEKVRRIKARYSLEEYSEIHCYGDSSGDREMLSLATHPYFREW